jgi:hypothetical protein
MMTLIQNLLIEKVTRSTFALLVEVGLEWQYYMTIADNIQDLLA